MKTVVSVLTILNLLGAAQGLLLAFALATMPRGNRTANRLLAAFVTVTAIQLLGAILFTTRYILEVPHLSRLHHPLLFLSAPLLFFYVRELTSQREMFTRQDWLHFLPAVLCVVILIPYFLSSAADKMVNLTTSAYDRWYYTRHAFAFTQGAIYLVFVARALRDYRQRIRQQNAPIDHAVWVQLRVLVSTVAVVFCGGLLRLLLRDRNLETNLIVPLGSSIMVYVVAWMGLTKPEALAGSPISQPQSRKYERSTLTPERAEEALQKLRHIMTHEKPYTDGELTLPKLAEQIALSPQHLSQLLNERCGQSFSDFVNAYRIAEARRLLTAPAKKHYSILAIAEEVGFNSKSTFNAAFRKHTGTTPSDFRTNSESLESA
ncbi:MAG: helix-turn-helix transcriptional regulator [Blastocatellia bacterium]|nr:helix-turn-helix transcriptional regulator [Blastocatellia bacterium]